MHEQPWQGVEQANGRGAAAAATYFWVVLSDDVGAAANLGSNGDAPAASAVRVEAF